MAIDAEHPLYRKLTGARIDPAIDAAEVLARYWNDRMPAGANIETITWWLRQGKTPVLSSRAG